MDGFIQRIATSGVYGLIDLGLEHGEASGSIQTVSGFKVSDIEKSAAFIGGLAGHFLLKGGARTVAGDVAVASLPLFEKVVINKVLGLSSSSSSTGRLVMRTGPQVGGRQTLPGTLVLRPARVY